MTNRALTQVLTSPDAFFADYADSDSAGLVRPALVVLVVAVVSAAGGALLFQYIRTALPPEMGAFATIILATTLVGALVGPFVSWVGLSLVFYVASVFFDGEGSFRRTLGAVGFGYLPDVAYALVSLGFTYVAVQSLPAPPTGGDPAAYAAFARQIQRDPLLRLSGGLNVVFTLWQAFLWTFALRHARELTLREAAITVGVPVLVLVAWSAYNLL